MKKVFLHFLLILTIAACKKEKKPAEIPVSSFIEPIEIPKIEYGYNLNDFNVKKDTIRNGDSFGQILFKNNVSYSKISEIAEAIKDTFDVRKINVNKAYTLLKSEDSLNQGQVFIYQKNKIDYVVIDFRDSITAYYDKLPVKLIEKAATGVIESSLSETIVNNNFDYELANELSDIYAWSLDFLRLQKGDRFKVLYTEKYINDTTYAGIDEVKAAYFEHDKKPFYAFQFVADTINNIPDYFDEEAKTLRKAFLKAPIKFKYRLSSRFSPRRFHPVQKRWKAHKGTDYAAKRGTPILATANGKVTKASYTKGNGNYVKIKHNSTYSTQYLHMSRRAVKVGQTVKQGEVIGYVGSTGLATGPHVCYRFWKNGRQVDPYKQKLPEAKPMDKNLRPLYFESIKDIKKQLDQVQFTSVK